MSGISAARAAAQRVERLLRGDLEHEDVAAGREAGDACRGCAICWNSADDVITPFSSSASPTCFGPQPCWTSTTMSVLLGSARTLAKHPDRRDDERREQRERRRHERGEVAAAHPSQLGGAPSASCGRSGGRHGLRWSSVASAASQCGMRCGTMRAMRFAMKTAPQHTTWADMLAVWQAADEIELFESAWTFDHFYPIFTDSTGPCLEGWITTDRAGPGHPPAPGRRARHRACPYRHPAVLANMAATLDIVSGGRLELGIGAGWNEEEADAYGIDLHATLTERFDAFDEGCEAIIGLLSNEQTTLHGRYVQLADARCNPEAGPAAAPADLHRGRGERRTLRSVARFAQHWNFPGGSVEQFVAKLDVLRRALRRRRTRPGRDHGLDAPAWRRRRARRRRVVEQAKRYGDAGLDLGIVYLQPPHTPDVLDELACALDPRRRLRVRPASPARDAPRATQRRPARGLALDAGGADRVARSGRASGPTSCRTAPSIASPVT